MNIKSIAWLTAAMLQIGIAGNALAVTVFTDRTDFENALASSDVETFENEFAYGVGNLPGRDSLDLTDFLVSTADPAIKVMGYEHSGSHNTTINGDTYLYLDTDIGLQGSTSTISLKSQADAFGFNYTGVFEPGTIFTIVIGSTTFDVTANNPEADPLFWGVLGLGTITDITITTSSDSGFGMDDVVYGTAVPLPPAIWLFASGLLALAGGARKRKARS